MFNILIILTQIRHHYNSSALRYLAIDLKEGSALYNKAGRIVNIELSSSFVIYIIPLNYQKIIKNDINPNDSVTFLSTLYVFHLMIGRFTNISCISMTSIKDIVSQN